MNTKSLLFFLFVVPLPLSQMYAQSPQTFGHVQINGDLSVSGKAKTDSGYTHVGPLANAFGGNNNAGGSRAFVAGNGSTATGAVAIALGDAAVASADHSIAAGKGTLAQTLSSFVAGRFNVSMPGSTTAWIATEPIFVIGNGVDINQRSNAMTVLKNGNMGVGTTAPGSKLELFGTFPLTDIHPANNAVRFSTSNGTISWALGEIGSYVKANQGNTDGYPGGLVFRTKAATGNPASPLVDRMVLDAAGNLGVGTTAPLTAKLEVKGVVKVLPGGDLDMGTFKAGTAPQ